MKKRKNENHDAELITVKQAAELTNLGTNSVRRIAGEAGAVRKIGKCYRINRGLLLSFVEQHCR